MWGVLLLAGAPLALIALIGGGLARARRDECRAAAEELLRSVGHEHAVERLLREVSARVAVERLLRRTIGGEEE